jgi:formylglycine-generating enzyme required for sulfatase activity
VRAIAFALPLATFSAAAACQVVGGYESFEQGEPPPQAPPHACDALPLSKTDEKLGRLVLSKQPGGTCVWVGETEVTVEQYRRFVEEKPNWDAQLDPQRCGWKTAPSDPARETTHECTVSTNMESEPFDLRKPIRCIDWCDARAFCEWAGTGKFLCGGNANASPGGSEPANTTDDWGRACAPSSGLALPYGDGLTRKEEVCNVGLSGAQCRALTGQLRCAPAKVGEFSQCKGPLGAVDMIGNVAEWVFMCSISDAGAETRCQHRGGSFADSLEDQTCYSFQSSPRNARERTIGLRCCAKLDDYERSLVK